MMTPLENAQIILQNARSDEVRIIYLADGRIQRRSLDGAELAKRNPGFSWPKR